MKLFLVGAKPGSLGAAVAASAREQGWSVVTAGISGEDELLDLVRSNGDALDRLVRRVHPDHIVCTSGINKRRGAYESTEEWYADHFAVNCSGPMRLLDSWLSYGPDTDVMWSHFVAISSNSAQIPRSDSAAYCASKAALSMAIRVRARDCSNHDMPLSVYAFEPGLLAGTPMTKEARERFTGPLTRMRGIGMEDGLSPYGLAGHIIRNIGFGGPELNGALLRLDAGEI